MYTISLCASECFMGFAQSASTPSTEPISAYVRCPFCRDDEGWRILRVVGLPRPGSQIRVAELVQSGYDLGRQPRSGGRSLAREHPCKRALSRMSVGSVNPTNCFAPSHHQTCLVRLRFSYSLIFVGTRPKTAESHPKPKAT